MTFLYCHTALLVVFRLNREVIKSTSEAVGLKIADEDACQRGKQFTSLFRSVDFVERMDHTLVIGSELVFVHSTHQVFIVSYDYFTLFFAKRTPFFCRQPSFTLQIHSAHSFHARNFRGGHSADDDVF